MKYITVKSLPLKEVIEDIAKAFDTIVFNSCEEYYLEVPKEIGKGYIKGVNFDSGLGIIIYDCYFKEDIEIQFIVSEIHPLKFIFCLEGELYHRFENFDSRHVIKELQEVIVASESHGGHILRFKKNTQIKINSLEIARDEFFKKIKCELVTMNQNLQELFNDIEANNRFIHEGFYSLKLAEIFNEMTNFNGKDFVRKMFLEAKAYEMLTHQIMQYEDDVLESEKGKILRRYEVKQIEKAVKIIKANIAEIDNVSYLANEVGLNVNKLQVGFRQLYGKSVNEYIQDIRLDIIKKLLMNQEYTISEIADIVGINSKSYLTKIFKDEFGTTPSNYRKEFMERMYKGK